MGRACFTSPLPGLVFGLDFCPARSEVPRLKPKWVASVNTLRTEVALVFLSCCLPLWGDIFSSDLACCFPTTFLALQIKIFFLTQHFKLCSEVKGSLPLLKTKISRSVPCPPFSIPRGKSAECRALRYCTVISRISAFSSFPELWKRTKSLLEAAQTVRANLGRLGAPF